MPVSVLHDDENDMVVLVCDDTYTMLLPEQARALAEQLNATASQVWRRIARENKQV